MTKTYTTEEITRRLKAGESITAINECKMTYGKVAFCIGNSYEYVLLKNKMEITVKSFVDNQHYFPIDEFLKYFMFTSDYENMKSEEKENIEEDFTDVTIPFGKKKETHKIEGNSTDIPEWLQRERVRFWGNSFREYKADYMKNTDDAISMANEDLKEFDKRFLNQKDTK